MCLHLQGVHNCVSRFEFCDSLRMRANPSTKLHVVVALYVNLHYLSKPLRTQDLCDRKYVTEEKGLCELCPNSFCAQCPTWHAKTMDKS